MYVSSLFFLLLSLEFALSSGEVELLLLLLGLETAVTEFRRGVDELKVDLFEGSAGSLGE